MPVLVVDATSIPYTIRRSARAKRVRIVIRPGNVEVVAPRRTWRLTIDNFVRAHGTWILEAVRRIEARAAAVGFSSEPRRYVSGARIPFRGRRLRLTVEPSDVAAPRLEYRSAFHVRIPRRLSEATREAAVRDCVHSWLKELARRDAKSIIAHHSPDIGRAPTAIRIGNQKTLWGSCSARGVISLNRRLMAAPRRIFEYVVVHELCHLRERNHSPAFWALVESQLADYRERRAWLKRHGISLS